MADRPGANPRLSLRISPARGSSRLRTRTASSAPRWWPGSGPPAFPPQPSLLTGKLVVLNPATILEPNLTTSFPTAAIAPDGTIYVAWAEFPQGAALNFRTSPV